MVRRFNLGVFYDLWPPFWPTFNKKMKKRKVDSSATFLRRIQICFQNRKIPILKFWPPIGGPLVTPWPLTSVVESSPTLFWPSKSVRWKVRTLSLMYFLCMSQLQKKCLKLVLSRLFNSILSLAWRLFIRQVGARSRVPSKC